jgi:hypothetical protein
MAHLMPMDLGRSRPGTAGFYLEMFFYSFVPIIIGSVCCYIAISSKFYLFLLWTIILYLISVYFIYSYTKRFRAYKRIQRWKKKRKKDLKILQIIKKEGPESYRADLKRDSKVKQDKPIVADKKIIQRESVDRDDDLI